MDPTFKHLAVQFFADKRLNKKATKKEGRPVYDDVEKVRFRIAGDPKTVHVGFADDQSSVRDPETNQRLKYKELHSGPYEAFKKNQEYVGQGTPLSEAPFLSEAKRAELKAVNVFTIEALAALDGSNLSRLGMGGRSLKEQAAAYLQNATGSADVTRLAAENEALKRRLEALEAKSGGMTNPALEAKPADAQKGPPSPFADWADEDIVNWIVTNGGEKPHGRCTHETIVAKADELNAALAEQNKAA
jgi:hypothetical protein